MTCFGDINVSQGSVATYARCGGTFNIHLTAYLPRNLPVKKIVNRLRFDRIRVTSLWPRFGRPCRKVWRSGSLVKENAVPSVTDADALALFV